MALAALNCSSRGRRACCLVGSSRFTLFTFLRRFANELLLTAHFVACSCMCVMCLVLECAGYLIQIPKLGAMFCLCPATFTEEINEYARMYEGYGHVKRRATTHHMQHAQQTHTTQPHSIAAVMPEPAPLMFRQPQPQPQFQPPQHSQPQPQQQLASAPPPPYRVEMVVMAPPRNVQSHLTTADLPGYMQSATSPTAPAPYLPPAEPVLATTSDTASTRPYPVYVSNQSAEPQMSPPLF